MSLRTKVILVVLLVSTVLCGIVYVQHVRYESLEQSHTNLKNTLSDLQKQVQDAETARLNLATRLSEVEKRRVVNQTIIKEVPVQPEEAVVSNVLKESLKGAR